MITEYNERYILNRNDISLKSGDVPNGYYLMVIIYKAGKGQYDTETTMCIIRSQFYIRVNNNG